MKEQVLMGEKVRDDLRESGCVGELVEEGGKLLELLDPADAEAVVGLLTQVDRCSSPVARALHAQIAQR